ncbi:MAG: hypothetical protein HZB24_01435 [Desulfobacterales bacterium]|nr:hypothetical protein [Desulfobacterales bacterium]
MVVVIGCGGGGGSSDSANNASPTPTSTPMDNTTPNPFDDDWPEAGNPDGDICGVPAEAGPEDISQPRTVVGDGTLESCTGEAFRQAVAAGGVITFDCGDDPVVITLGQTAKVVNDTGPEIVIDGGNKVTLSGNGQVRNLYMNACDPDQVWTTPHCDNQDHPRLTVQNLTFIEGNSTGETFDGGGGGAIFARGGRFKSYNCRFFNNQCDPSGSDVGGAAVRVLSQYETLPVYVVHSTFGGTEDLGNVGANGGALSSIGVSWTVLNSLFTHNRAIGTGANSGNGGNGGAIYNDGNTFTLNVCGSRFTDNVANEGGGAIFYVSNDESGTLIVNDSYLVGNPSLEFETDPGMFVIAGSTDYSGSTIEE